MGTQTVEPVLYVLIATVYLGYIIDSRRAVGAESRYELVPMFYRVSGTFRATDPTITKRMIRINPMRSGDDTVIRILKEAMEKVK